MVTTTYSKINKDVQEKVLRFGRLLQRNGLTIDKLILFGSYAKNLASPLSDIDVCVVSPAFGNDVIDETQYLFKKRSSVDDLIEPYPASRSEFESTSSPLMVEIRKYGFEMSGLL